MNRKKLVSIIFIILGIIMISYPLFLTMQSRIEQNKLKKSFKADLDNIISERKTDGRNTINEIPIWDKWPDTVLNIPSISLNAAVVEMNNISDFERKITQPPSHYPDSALPGTIGNIAIAGHVNGPAGYFKNLKKLSAGDEIMLNTPRAVYKYIVEKVFVTENNDWSVIAPTNYSALTLTTCERVGSNTSAKRLIVRAKFVNMTLQK